MLIELERGIAESLEKNGFTGKSSKPKSCRSEFNAIVSSFSKLQDAFSELQERNASLYKQLESLRAIASVALSPPGPCPATSTAPSPTS
eukprot:1471215-Lingulodinium_polyedra.AAC.1